MAFDNTTPPMGLPGQLPQRDPNAERLNDLMVQTIQQRIGSLMMSNANLEAQIQVLTEERDVLRAQIAKSAPVLKEAKS